MNEADFKTAVAIIKTSTGVGGRFKGENREIQPIAALGRRSSTASAIATAN
jgi:hypothetical protein